MKTEHLRVAIEKQFETDCMNGKVTVINDVLDNYYDELGDNISIMEINEIIHDFIIKYVNERFLSIMNYRLDTDFTPFVCFDDWEIQVSRAVKNELKQHLKRITSKQRFQINADPIIDLFFRELVTIEDQPWYND